MNDIIKHLGEKNFWYRKYLACTEAFLAALRHAPDLALDELELFYGNRESLLRILQALDAKIEDQVTDHERRGQELTGEQSTRAKFELREKDSIVEKIVLLDKDLMAQIDQLRAKGEEKLKLLAKGKKALSKYKSPGKQNEKIDKRL